MEKDLIGNVVAKARLQKDWITYITVVVPIFMGIAGFILSIVMGNTFQNYECVNWSSYYNYCYEYDYSFSFGSFFLSLLICAVVIFIYCLYANIYKKQELIVTDKCVKGKIKVFFDLMEITIPIDQVSTIGKLRRIFDARFMVIASSSGKHHFAYIENPDEIRNAIIKTRFKKDSI